MGIYLSSMSKYHVIQFEWGAILLVSVLSLTIILAYFSARPSLAAQDILSTVTKNTSNTSASIDEVLSISVKEGIIQPANCDFNRIGDCFDDARGFVFVWIENGTATLPQHFGVRNYSLNEGYALLPLDNILTK